MPSSETTTPSLSITLFGPLQVQVHARPLPAFRSRKPLWVLALLSLQASGEAERVKGRHRDWFLALAEEAAPRLMAAEQEMSLQRLETENENLRVALAWCRAEEDGAQAGLRLAGALGRFWDVRGYPTEGRRYLAEALVREEAAGRTPERARALNSAGVLAWKQGDYAEARSLYEESLGIMRDLGDRHGIAEALESFATLALKEGSGERAARLWGAASVLRESIGARLPPNEHENQERDVAAAREAMSDTAFTIAWEEGHAMTLEQAVAYALQEGAVTIQEADA